MTKYNPQEIEPKWQKKWQANKTYQAHDGSTAPKKYILDMFPYPSGEGLHVGHYKLYVASDIISRYFRTKGFNVLHPMGWDAFGLPAENYAIKTGIHPSIVTKERIANIKRQFQMGGLSYDWDREINTTDPNYYKWTQWIFLKLYEHGLAYEDTAAINWCPQDKTGLANEEVINGHCDRCGAKVQRKELRQWILRISKYADRLIEDLDDLEWPEFIKEMQRNWIGRSEGVLVKFKVVNHDQPIETFTTRIDTIFGVTAIVIAPEYSGLTALTDPTQASEVQAYVAEAKNKTDLDRSHLEKNKTGVFTGSYALHPFTQEKLPIWVADYVLGSYGTGAVMLVPAHDTRDQEFASKFNLPIKPVIDDKAETLINSQQFNGLSIPEAQAQLTTALQQQEQGRPAVHYKLRDWIFSRQRYWGEPIPIIHCPHCGIVPVPEDQLPLKLPEVERYEPTGTGESPLAAIDSWVNTTCPTCGGPAKRETNTMPQWAGSCWYYLRFCDPHNQQQLISPANESYWMPVDWYLGGAEHAVLHLLYARFWHKFLYDIGVVTTIEPFQKLSSVGLVLAEGGKKMSKSKGNVVSPDEIVNDYGADTLRLYEAFMGPFENTIAWDPNSINGVFRFLNRAWAMLTAESIPTPDQRIQLELNKLAQKVAQDIEAIKLNTAIAAMMKFTNLAETTGLTKDQQEIFAQILAPFAPHLAEEIWQLKGHTESITLQPWPEVEISDEQQSDIKIAIQVNGKVRGTMIISRQSSQEEAIAHAKGLPAIQKHLADSRIASVIYRPGRILNLVTE